eukprot:scaffold388_cov380-Prasinococcus_capsulatus_cf.AAC.34
MASNSWDRIAAFIYRAPVWRERGRKAKNARRSRQRKFSPVAPVHAQRASQPLLMYEASLAAGEGACAFAVRVGFPWRSTWPSPAAEAPLCARAERGGTPSVTMGLRCQRHAVRVSVARCHSALTPR